MSSTNSQTSLNLPTRHTALTPAELELLRLREIEHFAGLIYNNIMLGYPQIPEHLDKMGELLSPPVNPNQLGIFKD